MLCYRLTRRPYADLSGAGGLRVLGRWHAHRAAVIYAASSRALAMLEALVHLELHYPDLPRDYVYQVIDIKAEPERLTRNELIKGKRFIDTAAYGSQWLKQARSAALQVPSFVVPQEHNLILNAAHPAVARASYSIEEDVMWDERLFRHRQPPTK